MTGTQPSPRFLMTVQTTLRYWLAQTAVLDDATIHQLNPEFPNLLQAVKIGLALPEMWRESAQLILQTFFWIEGANHIGQWQPVVVKALQAVPTTHTSLCFRLLKQLGQFQRLQWDLETAVNTFKQAQLLARHMQDDNATAEIHMNLCETYRCQRQYERAETEGETALSLFSDTAPRLRAITWQSLGHIAKEQGTLTLAETRFKHALAIPYDASFSVVDKTRTLAALATIYQAQSNYHQALQLYQEIDDLLANTSQAKDQIENYINQGTLFYNWGKLDDAYTAFQAAAQMLKLQTGLVLHKAVIANNIANVCRDRREWLAAESYYQQSIVLYSQINNRLQAAKTITNLAKCYAQQGNNAAALFQFEQASTLLKQIPANNQTQLLQKTIEEQQTCLEQEKRNGKTASLPFPTPLATA
ncbi:MAG: tetratricopeptide repeat protein [Anaerolineales bacterium]|nr:tetratricopeptide repeat protein [Anaerolineales bacterium]